MLGLFLGECVIDTRESFFRVFDLNEKTGISLIVQLKHQRFVIVPNIPKSQPVLAGVSTRPDQTRNPSPNQFDSDVLAIDFGGLANRADVFPRNADTSGKRKEFVYPLNRKSELIGSNIDFD